MTQDNLKQKAASSMAWAAIQKYTLMGVAFVSSIILARLLMPYDYGCIGMLSIFIMISNILIDGGFGSALIQKKQPTDEDYSTIFYWNLFMSSVMYVVLYIAAPYIAEFYKIPLLSKVLRVQGIVLFINAFKMIQSNQIRKQFRFKPMAITNILTSLVSLSITVAMAYSGFGVWALVAQNLTVSIIPMFAFWYITKWHPQLIFSKESFKSLYSFGGFMFMTSIVNTIADNVQGLLIGRFYNPSTMGYYSKAKSTEELASNSIAQVVSLVTYQIYAEVQDEKNRLVSIIRRLTQTLSYVTFPLLALLMIQAKPIFVLLYSDRWLDSIPYFRVLCFAGFAICLQAITQQSIAAIGKSKTMFKWTFTNRILGIIMIVAGLLAYGIKGLLVVMVISSWFTYFIYAYLVSMHIGYGFGSQMTALIPCVLMTLAASVACMISLWLLPFNIYINAAISTIIYITIYFTISRVFKVDSYYYCKDLARLFTKKIFKK